MDPLIISICIIFSLVGCALGLCTGLIPGIHVNTLASLLLAAYSSIQLMLLDFIPEGYAPVAVCSLIMSASVVHSFVDFVPSVFIGAPDGEDAMSFLPGHRLLLKGEGMKAVRSAAIGSLIGCSAAILLAVPMQYIMLNGLADELDNYTKYILMAVTGLLLYNEWKKNNLLFGTIAFILSGILGWMVMELQMPSEGLFGEGTLLMPMLTGLFGLPTMILAAKGRPYPQQKDDVKDPAVYGSGLKGVLMGSVAGWFPGITSTVGATISSTVMPDRNPERFISTVASIGTVTTVLSLVTLSVSGGGRSGTVIVIGQILGDSINGLASESFMLMLLSASIGSVLGYILTIESGKALSKRVSKMDNGKVNRIIVLFLIAIVLLTTGPGGLFVLLCATVIGFIPVCEDNGKTVLCGCLILPVLLM